MSTDRLAVITGGAGGIAGATARILGPSHRLVIADLAPDAAVADLVDAGFDVAGAACDISDRDAVFALAEQVGPVDAIVHTAGIAPPDATDLRRIIDVDLLGTVHVLDAFLGARVAVVVASLGGHRSFARAFDAQLADPLAEGFIDDIIERAALTGRPLAAYGLAKRGTVVQVERRAAEWGRYGGRIVSVSPGLIADTGMGARAATIVGEYAANSALGRAGRADEVAAVIAFLCSDAASYISGCDILVDGGLRSNTAWHQPSVQRIAWHNAT